MQQTPLDHWLRKKFAYITRFYCNVLPADLPNGVQVEEAGANTSASHRYRLSTSSEEITQLVVDRFRLHGITYNAQIESKPGTASRLVSRPLRSLTYDVVWIMIILGVIGFTLFMIFSPAAHHFVVSTYESLVNES